MKIILIGIYYSVRTTKEEAGDKKRFEEMKLANKIVTVTNKR